MTMLVTTITSISVITHTTLEKFYYLAQNLAGALRLHPVAPAAFRYGIRAVSVNRITRIPCRKIDSRNLTAIGFRDFQYGLGRGKGRGSELT